MATGSHFGCPKITSYHFRSIPQFLFLWIFGCLKLTFGGISGHFRSIRTFLFLQNCILDVRNSLSIAFLAISDRSAILDVWNSLSIAILAISDRYRIFFRLPFWMSENHFWSHFWPFQIDRPFWMCEIHFRWHFWPFQIYTELNLFFKFFDKMAAGGHFGCPKITWYRISAHFRSIRNFFLKMFWQNGRRRPFWMGKTMSIIELVRDIWMSHACVKCWQRNCDATAAAAALLTKTLYSWKLAFFGNIIIS